MLLSSASGWEQEESFIEKVVGAELGALQAGPLRQKKEEDPFPVCFENLTIPRKHLKWFPACSANSRDARDDKEGDVGVIYDLGQYLKQDFVGLCLTWVFILSMACKIPALEKSDL